MDGKTSHERSSESPSFDDLNFSHSPTVEQFLQFLRAGRTDDCLQMIAGAELRLLDRETVDRYQGQFLQQSENERAYQTALELVKTERDTLLSGLYHFYQTFRFIHAGFEQAQKKEKAEVTATSRLLAKTLQLMGLKNVSPEVVGIITSIIHHLRQHMETVTKGVEGLPERLVPALEILAKHDIIELPAQSVESPKEEA